MPDQFENPANPGAHYASTGPEILADCEGRLDAFVACVGSGGTLGGTARFLRERLPGVRVVGAMPERSACAGDHGGTLVEGVIDDLGDCSQPDAQTGRRRGDPGSRCRGDDAAPGARGGDPRRAGRRASPCARRSAWRGSSGAGKRVVTIVPDTGRNYLSTYFDEAWRAKRGV